MKLQLLCSLILILACTRVNAQIPCGFDSAKALLNDNPAYQDQEKQINRIYFEQAIKRISGQKTSQTPLQIPIVVHVVHQNGPENISDSLIIAAIDQLNLRFQNAAPYFDSTGTDIQVQFCLASVDPFGNPTNGITRDVSAYTDVIWITGLNDIGLKNLNRWEPNLYLNIWFIRSITSLLGYVGYAFYPSATGTAEDGIVLQYNYINSNLLSHEAGHYLGLYHTFEGGCTNDNCLLDGDQVCDTPPDFTNDFICPANSCATEMNDTSGVNPFFTDVDDLPNYMDYTNCPLSFTSAQSDRMNVSLTQIRTTLLQSNGCGQNPGGVIPTASFTHTDGCTGAVFTSTSLNAVGAQWDFNNDGLIDDYGNTVTFNFPSTGFYPVTLYAAGYGGIDSVTQTIFAQVYPYQNYPMINSLSGVGPSLFTNQLVFCEGSTISFSAEPGMISYNWSTGDTTQNISFIGGTTAFTISLTAVDSSGLIWTTCYPLHVEPAPATIPPVISLAGTDTAFCVGDTVTLLFDYSPIVHVSNLFSSTSSMFGFQDSSFTTTLFATNVYWMNQNDSNSCFSVSNYLIIMADIPVNSQTIFQNGTILTYNVAAHHQWFLDGVPIPFSDTSSIEMLQTGCYKVFSWWANPECGAFSSDSVCIIINGLNANNQIEQLTIFPNPAFNEFIVDAGNNPHTTTTVYLMDALGRIAREQIWEDKAGKLIIDTRELSAGIYTLQCTFNGSMISKKVVIR